MTHTATKVADLKNAKPNGKENLTVSKDGEISAGHSAAPLEELPEQPKSIVGTIIAEEIAKVIPPAKVLSLDERINKVENLQLLVNKRTKLVEARRDLEKFQIGSNDFNCNFMLKDSEGNTFSTTFTPGIKKVIEFLKSSFDNSVEEIEEQITF